jgi:hypothetical protein
LSLVRELNGPGQRHLAIHRGDDYARRRANSAGRQLLRDELNDLGIGVFDAIALIHGTILFL